MNLGRAPSDKPTRDRNPRVHEFVVVVNEPFANGPKLSQKRPDGRSWPKEVRAWWSAISTMPHCALWQSGDWAFAQATAVIAADFYEGDSKLAAELRLREKDMGTTHNARLASRIRYVEPAQSQPADVTRLDDYRDL